MRSKENELLQQKILNELIWYRLLTFKQIHQLIGTKDERHLRVQISALIKKGYIYQRYLADGGKIPSAFQLLHEGKKYIETNGGEVPYTIPSLSKIQTYSSLHIRHTLGVNALFILLLQLTGEYPDRFRLLTRIHEREMSKYLVKSDGGVEPDGFVLIEVCKQGAWKKQSFFLEYERTTGFSDMGKYQQKIRDYLHLFDKVNTLEVLFGVKFPSLMTIVDDPERVPFLVTYCAEVLQQMNKQDQESRFRFTSLDTSLSPAQFFCSERWYRAWLPIPAPVAYFPGME